MPDCVCGAAFAKYFQSLGVMAHLLGDVGLHAVAASGQKVICPTC